MISICYLAKKCKERFATQLLVHALLKCFVVSFIFLLTAILKHVECFLRVSNVVDIASCRPVTFLQATSSTQVTDKFLGVVHVSE